MRGLKPTPADMRPVRVLHPGQVSGHKQPHTLTFTPRDNSSQCFTSITCRKLNDELEEYQAENKVYFIQMADGEI